VYSAARPTATESPICNPTCRPREGSRQRDLERMATPTATGRSIYSDPSFQPTTVYAVEPRPRAAAALIGIGAWFVLIEGLLLVILGAFVASSSFDGLGGGLVIAGVIDAFVGVLMFGVALLVYSEPHHHLANGLLALVLVVLSFMFGFGGFVIGAIFVTLGAILAIVWSPPRAPLVVAVTRPGTPASR
jgi:hypothetical protein